MPWKDQGGNGGGPWGGGGDDNGPGKDKNDNPWTRRRPTGGGGFKGGDIDDIISKLQRRLKDSFSGKGGGNTPKGGGTTLLALIAAGIVGIWLLTGFYRVQEGELGVVKRFGAMVREAPPGLRYHLPSPIESVIIKKVATVNTINSNEGEKNNESDQNLILTGDENMVHTNYTVLWTIKDVKEYLFTAIQPEVTIRAAAESVIREVIGQTTARLALTEGRDSIGTKAQELLQSLLNNYKMGIQIVSVQLQNVAPPKQVIDAFNDVQASLVDADRVRNEAEAYRNGIIPVARGQAQQIIQEAEGYNQQVIAQAHGDAAKFGQVLAAYQTNKVIAKTRLYFDTMQLVLQRVPKMLIDAKTSKTMLPYLPLNEMKAKSAAPSEEKEKK